MSGAEESLFDVAIVLRGLVVGIHRCGGHAIAHHGNRPWSIWIVEEDTSEAHANVGATHGAKSKSVGFGLSRGMRNGLRDEGCGVHDASLKETD